MKFGIFQVLVFAIAVAFGVGVDAQQRTRYLVRVPSCPVKDFPCEAWWRKKDECFKGDGKRYCRYIPRYKSAMKWCAATYGSEKKCISTCLGSWGCHGKPGANTKDVCDYPRCTLL